MRTVLHIGIPKTGTTALQTSLQNSYSILLRSGVLYPKCGRGIRFSKHVLMLQPVLEFERLPRSLRQDHAQPEDIRRWHEIYSEAVRSQIASQKPRCTVLSSENLARPFDSEQLRRMSDELESYGVGEVEVAVYLRRPSSFFLSSAQQKLKASHQLKQPSARAYRAILEAYAELVGQQNVRPRVFDRAALVDGDIVADFCAAYLADEGVDPKALKPGERSNETMSAEAMDIVLRYRWDFERENDDMHTRGSRSLRAALREAEPEVGASRPRLREGIADLIDYSSPDILWLRDTYGVKFAGLDYSRLEKDGPMPMPDREYGLDEIVEVDPQTRSRLLAELAKSKWARKSDAHRDWVSGLLKEAA